MTALRERAEKWAKKRLAGMEIDTWVVNAVEQAFMAGARSERARVREYWKKECDECWEEKERAK